MNKETPETHSYWISVLQEDERKTSPWEKEFISDMTIRLTNRWPLTDAQEAKLEQIYVTKAGK